MDSGEKPDPGPRDRRTATPRSRGFHVLASIALTAIGFAVEARSARAAECTLRFEKVGPAAESMLGYAVSAAGDVDQDGSPDLAVSSGDRRVRWYRGAGGTLVRSIAGTGCFGEALAMSGDLDGDGVPDLVVGNPCDINPEYWTSTGSVSVLSGRTGGTVRTVYGVFECSSYGSSIAGAGDANGDGTPDLLVGAPVGACIPPSVTHYDLLSGADGHLIRWRLNQEAGGSLGSSLTFIEDLDGDGRADYLVGDAGDGLVDLLSGMSGQTIRHLAGESNYGASLADLGDLDGDGRSDFAIGASSGRGYVRAYSGANGALLLSLTGADADDAFGARVEGIGDVSGDGQPDFVVGAPRWNTARGGSAYVYSGRDGGLLCELGGGADSDRFGSTIARIGDLDGDGRSEFGIGAPYASIGGQHQAGRVGVYGVTFGPPLGEARHLEVTRSLTGIELRWDPPGSCTSPDYAVYRGTLASLARGEYDHAPLACTTGGSTGYTHASAPDASEYFLVAVSHLNEEGSLGASSDGNPRPMGAPSCAPFRNTAACP